MNDDRVTPAKAEGVGYTLVEHASLQGRNTFRVAARANLLVDVRTTAALEELFGYAMLRQQPLLVLGEGSNILFTRDWPGVVLSMATRGIAIVEDDGVRACVRVEAGEGWNDFVHWSIGHGFAGMENLVLIPGTVGAAPIQNIGAYGVEVREFITAVEAWDRPLGRIVRLDPAQCAFAYRDSVFKRERNRFVVTAVEFELSRTRALKIDYAGVREELAALGVEAPDHRSVAEAITRIRLRRLPNPALIGNAGSFFKNPVVDGSTAASLKEDHPDLPVWPASGGRSKISAAWLIESCGFKGSREGDAGVSDQHALVLVNHGNARGADLLALADRIRGQVRARYGVDIEPEPLIV